MAEFSPFYMAEFSPELLYCRSVSCDSTIYCCMSCYGWVIT